MHGVNGDGSVESDLILVATLHRFITPISSLLAI